MSDLQIELLERRLAGWREILEHPGDPDYGQLATGKPYSVSYVRRRIKVAEQELAALRRNGGGVPG